MKNVLLFTHNLNNGGAEKVVRTIAEYINASDCGWTAWICVVYDDPALRRKLHNVIVMRHKSAKADSKMHKALNVIRQISEMKKIKKEHNIDVCISFLPGADIINVLSGMGEKKIVSVRSIESKFTHSIWKKIYVKLSYALCDKIVAVSGTVRQDCISYFRVSQSKIMTIYNPANDNMPTGLCVDAFSDFSTDKFVCISVGRLDPAKGHAHLIRAFRKVVDQIPNAGLVVIGEGDLLNTLKGMVREFHLEENVLMLGYCANPCDYMKRTDLFVYPSNIDGMSNVVIEAMQCSLPVVSTDCGGPSEILAPEKEIGEAVKKATFYSNGMLLPVCGNDIYDTSQLTKEEEQMALGIIEFIKNDDKRRGYSNNAKKSIEKLDLSVIGNDWISVINEITKAE